ncbi:hypothetical protein DV737_g4172, partial [Chaetothyriales sp. CBS 132003]
MILKLPTGPPTLPLIGNLHQLPKSGAHFKFTEWAQQYGGIFSLKLGPATAVVISSPALVKALIDKKSSIYSSRPPSYVSHDLMTRGDHLLVMMHGDKWRLFRKLVHQQFNEVRCEREHITLQNAEAVQMMRDFCVAPGELMNHPKRFSNSIVMALLFGIRSPSPKTPHLVELYKMMEEWSKVMETGATPPVDIYPFLKYVPESLLGNWITRSRNVGKAMDRLYGRMVLRVTQRRAESGSRGSFLDTVLDQQEKLKLTPNQLNFLCGVLMEGGSDTSSSIITAFIQALIKNPEVQRKAHEQIDLVVGEDRSPTWSDYAQLPYVAMIVKETMRWRPVTPLAFPHALSQDDVVDGMLIPKGTTVILNVWGLQHDPARHANPDVFNPERYAGRTLLAAEYAASANYENRDHYGYGSGRRICPGIHLAERSLFLAMAKLLWAFDFSEKKDAQGNVVAPVDSDIRTGYSEGFLVCAIPFRAEISVRSKAHQTTIMNEFAKAEAEDIMHPKGRKAIASIDTIKEVTTNEVREEIRRLRRDKVSGPDVRAELPTGSPTWPEHASTPETNPRAFRNTTKVGGKGDFSLQGSYRPNRTGKYAGQDPGETGRQAAVSSSRRALSPATDPNGRQEEQVYHLPCR